MRCEKRDETHKHTHRPCLRLISTIFVFRRVLPSRTVPAQMLRSLDACVSGGSWSCGKRVRRSGGGAGSPPPRRCVHVCLWVWVWVGVDQGGRGTGLLAGSPERLPIGTPVRISTGTLRLLLRPLASHLLHLPRTTPLPPANQNRRQRSHADSESCCRRRRRGRRSNPPPPPPPPQEPCRPIAIEIGPAFDDLIMLLDGGAGSANETDWVIFSRNER